MGDTTTTNQNSMETTEASAAALSTASLRSEPFPEDNSCNPSTSPVQSSLAVQLRYPEKSEMVNLQTVHRTCLDRYAEEEHLVDLADR